MIESKTKPSGQYTYELWVRTNKDNLHSMVSEFLNDISNEGKSIDKVVYSEGLKYKGMLQKVNSISESITKLKDMYKLDYILNLMTEETKNIELMNDILEVLSIKDYLNIIEGQKDTCTENFRSYLATLHSNKKEITLETIDKLKSWAKNDFIRLNLLNCVRVQYIVDGSIKEIDN